MLWTSHCSPRRGVSSSEHDEAPEIKGMVMRESDGESGETLRQKNYSRVSCKELSKTPVQASARQELMPLPSASQADVSEKHCLCEKLEAVLHSVVKSSFRWLKVHTSDKRRSRFPVSGSGSLTPSPSSGCHQEGDPRSTQAVHEEQQTEFTNSDDFVSSKPPLSCLNPSTSYEDPIPAHCRSLLFLPPSKLKP